MKQKLRLVNLSCRFVCLVGKPFLPIVRVSREIAAPKGIFARRDRFGI
jgi:hypothetical protein